MKSLVCSSSVYSLKCTDLGRQWKYMYLATYHGYIHLCES